LDGDVADVGVVAWDVDDVGLGGADGRELGGEVLCAAGVGLGADDFAAEFGVVELELFAEADGVCLGLVDEDGGVWKGSMKQTRKM